MQTQEYGQLKLSDEEKERETVFGLMIERQHSEPSDKNKESLFLAMKDAFVYVPMHFAFTAEEMQKLMKTRDVAQVDMNNVKYSPIYYVNQSTGEKILPCFSRLEEFSEEDRKKKIPFGRMKLENLVKIADTIPEAFDFAFDFHTHLVRMTLDELMEGLGLSDNSEEEGSEE